MKNKVITGTIILGSLLLGACDTNTMDHNDHVQMEHKDGTSELPKGIKSAEHPKFEKGSKVLIKSGHMDGMKGAEALIAGAYNTTAYEVTYQATNGGKKVTNHKWVVQEEIKDAGQKRLMKGNKVTLEADHMKGMKGAKGVIDGSEKTTVYMVNYDDVKTGEQVKFHKWVTEDELEAKK